jgi:hypothetical protein
MKTRLTKKKINEFIKDEKAGARAYSKFGLPHLASDERKHKRILLKIKRRLKK